MIPWESRTIRRMDYLTLEQMVEVQQLKLERLLKAAYNHSPFYRRRFDDIRARPEDFRRPQDLSAFPLLTRDDILAHSKELLTMPAEKLRIGRSGGSTGHPLYFYYHHDYKYRRKALLNRWYHWLGVDNCRPVLLLWGSTMRPNIPATIRPWHRFFLPDFRYGIQFLDEEGLGRIAREVQQFRPALVMGYASTLLSLARYLKTTGIVLPQSPKAVISTAEMLFPEDRTMIEESFHSPVYNSYGSNENYYFAPECTARLGFHVMTDHVYPEILANNQPTVPGQPGRIIVTDLDNLAMPFIRYDTEDIGSWSANTCTCGRTLPLMETVYGRDTDFIFDRFGASYPGINMIRPLRPASAGDRIRQFQYRQSEPGRFELLAVKGAHYTPDAESILNHSLREEFRDRMDFHIIWVDEIEPEASGKIRFIKSSIKFGK